MDPNTINLFVCPIIEMPKNRGNYLRVCFMSKRVIDNLIMDFTASTPGPKMKKVDFLKFRTDACKLSTFQSKNPMVASIFKNLVRGDNFPKGCPLQAVSICLIYGKFKDFLSIFLFFQNFTYIMAHFALNPDYFPPYTPEMNFTTKMNIFVDKKQIIYASMEARIVKRN